MPNPTEKPCSACGEVKALDEFSPHSRGLLGRQAKCKACYCAYRAANADKSRASQKAYYDRNKEAIRAKAAERLAADPSKKRDYYLANREAIRAKQAEYRRANADKKRQRDAAYREANREKVRASFNKWALENADVLAESRRRRDALKRGGSVSKTDLAELWTGTCALCDQELSRDVKWPDPLSPSVDHIIPLAAGGAHKQANLQWAHLICNQRKGKRLIA